MSESKPALRADNRQGAEISDDGQYRYRLYREWDAQKPTLAFLMLNPSTADGSEDDPTIRRCINYAKDWGFGRLEVANLFALRSPDPDQLTEHPNPVGPENNEYVENVCYQADKVIAAWGANGGLMDRGPMVTEMVDEILYALDTTKDGHPVHPLYQPADAVPEVFDYDE